MKYKIEFFASFTSPYCYFALYRLARIAAESRVPVVLRLVRPGIVRMADSFNGRSPLEQAYFVTDVLRTAQFLGLPFAFPDPYPAQTEVGTLYVAAATQPHIWRLHNLVGLAQTDEQRFGLYSALMRRIWSGTYGPWHEGPLLEDALAEVGLPTEGLRTALSTLRPDIARRLDENEARFTQIGHRGVPTFALEDEPFYGQDRLDQLQWRLARLRSATTSRGSATAAGEGA